MNKPLISVIIANHNTPELTIQCLKSLSKLRKSENFEVILIDNGSSKDNLDKIIKYKNKSNWLKFIRSEKNLGFARANNLAGKKAIGKYILFLNSDTVVYKGVITDCLKFLQSKNAGAVSCKLVLKNGKMDPDTRRSFPTPFVALTHLVLKLDRIFPKSKLFSKYWYGYISENSIHEVDVIQGAFMLIPKNILNTVGWFDETYFLDGEDIDLCWKIKAQGYPIYYYPRVSILHLKGATKGKNKEMYWEIPLKERIGYAASGVTSMEKFYKNRMWSRYPLALNIFVLIGIRAVKFFRILGIIIRK